MTDVRINVPPRLIEAARAAQYANRAKISNKERLERIKKGIAVQSTQQQKKKFPLTQEREGGQLEFTRVKRQKVWTKRRIFGRGFVIKGKDYQENLLPVEVQNIFEGKNYAFNGTKFGRHTYIQQIWNPLDVYAPANLKFNTDKNTGHMKASKSVSVNFSFNEPEDIYNESGSVSAGEIVFFPLRNGYLNKYEIYDVQVSNRVSPRDFFTAVSYKSSNGEERQYIDKNSPMLYVNASHEIKDFFEVEKIIDSDLPMTLEAKVQLGQLPSPYAPAPKYDGDESGTYNETYFSITSPLFTFTVGVFLPLLTDAWTLLGLTYMPVNSRYFFQGSHELHIAYVYYKNRIQGFLNGSLFLDTKPSFGDIPVSFASGLFPIVIRSESYYVNINYTPGSIIPFRKSIESRSYTPSPECCAIFKGFRCTMGEALYTDSFTPPESITSLI